jgi:hypothetical protein
MSYICRDPERWEKEYANKLVGNGQCVAFVRAACHAPPSSLWKEGEKVKADGSQKIAKGTAIATFFGGKYPNYSSGNHTAVYLTQNKVGIVVLDQWVAQGAVKKRTIRFTHKGSVSPVDDGTAYSIVK